LLAYLETPVLIATSSYKTAYINPAFEKIFLVEFRDVLGKDFSSYLPPSAVEVLTGAGERVKETGVPSRFLLREGNRHFTVGASAIRNDSGRITGLLFNLADVTKARQLEQLRADFISLLLNDLRAPLAEISFIFSKMGLSLPGDSSLRSDIESGAERVRELMDHLDGWLYVTNSIGEEIKLSESENNPGMLLSTAVNSLKRLAGKSRVTVETFGARVVSTWRCDRDKILQVFIYLVTEQIKRAGEGGTVSVGLSLLCNDGAPERLVVAVAQPSAVIEDSEVPELFGDVSSGHADPTRVATGKIIAAHDGRFHLVRTANSGCAMVVSFPLLASGVS